MDSHRAQDTLLEEYTLNAALTHSYGLSKEYVAPVSIQELYRDEQVPRFKF